MVCSLCGEACLAVQNTSGPSQQYVSNWVEQLGQVEKQIVEGHKWRCSMLDGQRQDAIIPHLLHTHQELPFLPHILSGYSQTAEATFCKREMPLLRCRLSEAAYKLAF